MTFHDRQKCVPHGENAAISAAAPAARILELFAPGSAAPRHGVYECGCVHQHQFLTTAAGDVLPPLDIDCAAASWRLLATGPEIPQTVQ